MNASANPNQEAADSSCLELCVEDSLATYRLMERGNLRDKVLRCGLSSATPGLYAALPMLPECKPGARRRQRQRKSHIVPNNSKQDITGYLLLF